MENKYWKILLLGIAILGAIGLFLIIRYCLTPDHVFLFSSSTTKLRAVVQYSQIRFPPKLEDAISKLLDGNESIFVSSINKEVLNDLKFKGYWSAKVNNKGNSVCTAVSIRLPYSEMFVLKRENFESSIIDSKNVCFIGNLAPLEEVIIYGWTSRYLEPSFKNKQAIKLTYDKGIGRVVLKLPLADYRYYFIKCWALLLLLWSLAICAIMLYLFIGYREANESPIIGTRPRLIG